MNVEEAIKKVIEASKKEVRSPNGEITYGEIYVTAWSIGLEAEEIKDLIGKAVMNKPIDIAYERQHIVTALARIKGLVDYQLERIKEKWTPKE